MLLCRNCQAVGYWAMGLSGKSILDLRKLLLKSICYFKKFQFWHFLDKKSFTEYDLLLRFQIKSIWMFSPMVLFTRLPVDELILKKVKQAIPVTMFPFPLHFRWWKTVLWRIQSLLCWWSSEWRGTTWAFSYYWHAQYWVCIPFSQLVLQLFVMDYRFYCAISVFTLL